MVNVKVFTFNLFAENTIVLWDSETKEAAVIDPGTSTHDEEKTLADFISSEDLKVKYLLNTHCHIDHILGCKFIKEKYNPVYYAPEKDIPLLDPEAIQSTGDFRSGYENASLPTTRNYMFSLNVKF